MQSLKELSSTEHQTVNRSCKKVAGNRYTLQEAAKHPQNQLEESGSFDHMLTESFRAARLAVRMLSAPARLQMVTPLITELVTGMVVLLALFS